MITKALIGKKTERPSSRKTLNNVSQKETSSGDPVPVKKRFLQAIGSLNGKSGLRNPGSVQQGAVEKSRVISCQIE